MEVDALVNSQFIKFENNLLFPIYSSAIVIKGVLEYTLYNLGIKI